MTNADVVATLTRLADGRSALSAAELRRVVPVETMGVEDLAALLAELEERGITVDIDPALLAPRHPVSPQTGAAAAVRARVETSPPASMATPVAQMSGGAPTSGSAAASSRPARASTATQSSQRAVTIAVLAAGAVVVIVLTALIWGF
jgi:hypothetical protein